MSTLILFVLAAALTFAIRYSGIALFAGDRELSPGWARTLELAGPAAMAAIAANTLLIADDGFRSLGAWHLMAVAAAAMAVWKRDTNWILLAGAAGFVVFRLLGL
ncbi:AzlD domain-containing protein [Demequina sp. TTPB684]|uniref:AzlD domain-containing protein n=1 Tax=unclassified Demequina TaxID=2620311 RepID=UPI001CF1872F|nr:AzlD domain-containing protein [Demequina sp. TMPB413]MCB2412286.1 AzlD domain-containing protein [Demequina sp. TTPB684]UPU87566.1 AzlD domain-containing protein [Demequina sp. TMPB413]